MILYQISKILEIGGFTLASIFGVIFLSRDVSGNFAHRIDSGVTSISQKINTLFFRWLSPLINYSEIITKHEITRQMLAGISVRGLSIAVLIVGLMFDISWLFWLGLVLSSVYALLSAIGAFIRTLYISYKNHSLLYIFSYPLILCWGLLLGFVIAPILVILYMIAVYSLLVLSVLTGILIISDNLKKGLIILGSTLAVVGLILETIATW